PPTLAEILVRASSHAFYTDSTSPQAISGSETTAAPSLSSFQLLTKDRLNSTIQTLMNTDPTFLHGAYLSLSGGTRSSKNLYFVTDAVENRELRVQAGKLMNTLGVVTSTDIVANLHGVNVMYQSQSLCAALVEYAGGTHLSLTAPISDENAAVLVGLFKPTVILTTANRALQLARYVAALPASEKFEIKKLIYSSEMMTPQQEVYLGEALGVELLASLYGSAEVLQHFHHIADLAHGRAQSREYREFVADGNMVIMEVINELTGEILASTEHLDELKEGSAIGELVLTSLLKYKHPLVRYRTGDIGSLHPYHGEASAGGKNPDVARYFSFRLYGRNPLKSFKISSLYIDLETAYATCLSKPEYDILEWQVIVDHLSIEELAREAPGTAGDYLEFRVVTKGNTLEGVEYEENLRKDLVRSVTGADVKTIVKRVGYDGLERARNAAKVLRLVDRRVLPGSELDRRAQ
ncbi:hypothetical protein DFH27DRAFT_637405, partial [Peziza echinospora]